MVSGTIQLCWQESAYEAPSAKSHIPDFMLDPSYAVVNPLDLNYFNQ